MRRGPSAALLAVAALVGCARPIRTGALIDRYRSAECVPVRFAPGIQPRTREWDYTLKIRDGIDVRVDGAQMPGGRINVRYVADGKQQVAANAGDYIYPSDVRFDRAGECLYVKASGVPAAFWRTPNMAL